MLAKPAAAPSWIKEVLPDAKPIIRLQNSKSPVWEFSLPAARADQTLEPFTREIYVLHRVRRAHWKAYWRPGFQHRSSSATWPDEVRSISRLMKEAPWAIRSTLRQIRDLIRVQTKDGAGWPDLAIWHPVRRHLRFIEVKGPGESMQKSQVRWLEMVIAEGLIQPSDVAIVRVPKPVEPRTHRRPQPVGS